jgi:hypothetical protein
MSADAKALVAEWRDAKSTWALSAFDRSVPLDGGEMLADIGDRIAAALAESCDAVAWIDAQPRVTFTRDGLTRMMFSDGMIVCPTAAECIYRARKASQ